MKKRFFVGIFLFCFCFFIIYGLFWYFSPPVINAQTLEVTYGEEFELDELEVDEAVVSKEIVEGEINVKKIGKQQVTVRVANQRNISNEALITVFVIDKEAPYFYVSEEFIVEAKQPFNLKDFVTVIDNVDGDVTDSIIISSYSTERVKEQEVVLFATDSSGNLAKKTIVIDVVDTTEPIILAKDITILEGEDIDLLKNVSANDIVDGNITDKIKVIGQVDINKPNTYKITYEVKDFSGNKTKEVINVNVKQRYKPMHLYFNKKAISYKNGGVDLGQQIIDSGWRASTWGGASVFSGTDELNTHFIAHNPGPFQGIQNAKRFVITDFVGNIFEYETTRVYKVNVHAIGISDGKNYWERITGTSGGERVTFQACYNSTINWIIEAKLVGTSSN